MAWNFIEKYTPKKKIIHKKLYLLRLYVLCWSGLYGEFATKGNF